MAGARPLYRPVRPAMPDLSTVQYGVTQARPTFPSNPTPSATHPNSIQSLWAKARLIANSHLRKSRNDDLSLVGLPHELLLEIASHLPAASLICLALTCKTLFNVFSSPTLFTSLDLPAEQPSGFRLARMSKPFNYQPVRQDFLSTLERDLKAEWQLCSECFVLHPRSVFAEFETSITPWHRKYYKRHALDYRSCRHAQEFCTTINPIFTPVGIVDLCPCIKLTRRRKRCLESQLRQNAKARPREGDPPVAANYWWHQCQHSYCDGAFKLDIRIGVFLYDGTGSEALWACLEGIFSGSTRIVAEAPQTGRLGVLIDYRYTYPSSKSLKLSKRAPRLLCPHLILDVCIHLLLYCRKRHTLPNKVCSFCEALQYCKVCRMKVLNLREIGNTELEADMTTCTFQVERCLDDRLWSVQTVFPYYRRHTPLTRDFPHKLQWNWS